MTSCPSCEKGPFRTEYDFCPFCGADLDARLCKNCGQLREADSDFCPFCGGRASNERDGDSKDDTSERASQSTDLIMEFGESRSPYLKLAIQLARSIPGFRRVDGAVRRFRVRVPRDEIDMTVVRLASIVSDWKSSELLIGDEIKDWDTVFGFSDCLVQRNSSFDPQGFCFGAGDHWNFNLWGCQQLRMNWRHPEWGTLGKWVTADGRWKFDRPAIRYRLNQRAASCKFCPAFKPALPDLVVDLLPDEVNPNQTASWRFLRAQGPGEGTILVDDPDGYFSNQIYVCGVAPLSGAIQEIVTQIRRRVPHVVPEGEFEASDGFGN